MKRYIALLLPAALLIALSGCVPAGQAVPEPTEAAAVTAEPAPAADAQAAVLTGILQNIAERYQPGTAGCSLQAAKLAGALLDWNAGARLNADAIMDITARFYNALDAEAASLFSSEQLPGVYEAAKALLTDTAPDYLESAGYQPASYPWPAVDVEMLFAALYEGAGLQLPAA